MRRIFMAQPGPVWRGQGLEAGNRTFSIVRCRANWGNMLCCCCCCCERRLTSGFCSGYNSWGIRSHVMIMMIIVMVGVRRCEV